MNYKQMFWELHNNQLAKELLGVEVFHKTGYTGSRVNIGNLERANCDHPAFEGKVIDIHGIRNYNDFSKNHHGDKTNLILHNVAPDATIYLLDRTRHSNNDNFIKKSYKTIKDKSISVVTDSVSFDDNGERNKLVNDLIDNYNVKFTVCAHNAHWDYIPTEYPKRGFSVSGCHLTSKGEFFHPSYAIKGRPIRAVNSYVPMYTPSLLGEDRVHYEQGTSFSAPFFAGMLALLDDFFIDKIGRPLHRDEVLKFIKDNQLRLEDVNGEPNYIFVLPNPSDIDVDKYILKDIPKPTPKPESKPEKPKEVDEMKFKDVEQHRWYAKAIDFVSQKGYMGGYDNGTFQPNKPITRAEIAQILYNIMK